MNIRNIGQTQDNAMVDIIRAKEACLKLAVLVTFVMKNEDPRKPLRSFCFS
jgi:hypothetical protein